MEFYLDRYTSVAESLYLSLNNIFQPYGNVVIGNENNLVSLTYFPTAVVDEKETNEEDDDGSPKSVGLWTLSAPIDLTKIDSEYIAVIETAGSAIDVVKLEKGCSPFMIQNNNDNINKCCLVRVMLHNTKRALRFVLYLSISWGVYWGVINTVTLYNEGVYQEAMINWWNNWW